LLHFEFLQHSMGIFSPYCPSLIAFTGQVQQIITSRYLAID
jgi:hypothetical protein